MTFAVGVSMVVTF